MSSAESSTEECIQTPERGETPVTGPWRVAEEAPPPPEDVNNLTWEHFPVIEDSQKNLKHQKKSKKSGWTATSPAKWNKSATSVFLAGFSGSCLTGKKEKEKEAKEKAEKTTNTRRHKGTRECPTTKRSHKSAPEEKVQDTGNDGGTEAGPERNTWNPPQHYPQRNARVNRGRGTQQTPLRTSREDPTPTKVSEGESGTPAIRGTHTGGRDRGTPTRKEDTTWETDTMVGQTIKEETPSGEQEEEKEDSGKKKIQTIGHGIGGAWPGRPVLSGCSSPTRPVDRLLTTYLTPLLDLLPERLQDTTSFLQKMRDAKRYPGAILFSFDIVSLYPSIPQEEAAYVVANFYEQNFSYVEERLFSDFNMAAPPPYLIKEGIDHVLGGTLLRFNNSIGRSSEAVPERNMGMDQRKFQGHTLGNSLQDPPTNDSMEERKIDCREADQSAVPVASGRAQGVNEWQTTRLRYLKENRGGPRLPQSSKPAV
ncbi:hypothetical protein C7M84_019564 [Penaeus vannamei]|uniref:Reverse transcriptase domain-containing protein n=1 Tax=Penaeus vannamei TaxID=6689 RepID=A0A423SED9_PENVA|nr:hypothetical protein C7M84_019564 [Penaeus vannamei]